MCSSLVCEEMPWQSQNGAAQSEDLSALFDIIPIPILVVDGRRRVVKANQAAMSSLVDLEGAAGTSGGDYLGCVHVSDNQRGCGFGEACQSCGVREQVIDTLETGASHRKKEQILSIDNDGVVTEYPLLTSTAALERDGERHCIIVIEEISEIKSLEKKAQESERLVRGVFNAAEDWISFKDRDFRYTRVNEALAAALDKKPQDLVGFSDFELMPYHMAETIHRADEMVLDGYGYRGEFDRQINGSVRRIESVKAPLKDDDDNVIGICTISRDVTELRDASRRIESSAQRMQRILDSAADGIYGIDGDGICTFCNPTALRLLGYESESDLVGKNVHELIHHSQPDGTRLQERDCPIHRVLEKGESSIGEDLFFWRADGTCFPVDYRVASLRGGDGEMGSVVSFSDISERIAMQEKIRRLDKYQALGVLARGVAHNINNMLTPALLCVESLDPNLYGDARSAKALGTISKAQNRIREVARRLLMISGQSLIAPSKFDASALARRVIAEIHHSLPKGVLLKERIDDGLGLLRTDQEQFYLLVSNIIRFLGASAADGRCEIHIDVCRGDAMKLDQGSRGEVDTVELHFRGTGVEGALANACNPMDPLAIEFTEGSENDLELAAVHAILFQLDGKIRIGSEDGAQTYIHVQLPLFMENQSGDLIA